MSQEAGSEGAALCVCWVEGRMTYGDTRIHRLHLLPFLLGLILSCFLAQGIGTGYSERQTWSQGIHSP